LNHFTVPVAIYVFLSRCCVYLCRADARTGGIEILEMVVSSREESRALDRSAEISMICI